MEDINFSRYKKLVADLPFGKSLVNVVYIYKDSLNGNAEELLDFIEQVKARLEIKDENNVIKFFLTEFKVSLINYPQFFEIPHPELKSSVTINLTTGKTRKHDYRNSLNPPILHRKELLLHPAHPLIKKFKALTGAEEVAGLYQHTKTIGFKRNWESLLADKGLSYDRHRLIKKVQQQVKRNALDLKVDRHKTAISRYALSKPIQTILEYGLIDESTSVFDFGCGKGDDLKGLSSMGYQVKGWDPVYMPEEQKRAADIVNLGYVLNIIEDPAERTEVLLDAFSLCRKMLVVSSMLATSATAGRPYGDGVLTSRNTFQKYFEQDELRQLIEDVLETSAVAVAPGIFYIFRSPTDQQQFLSFRSKRQINWEELSRKLYPKRPRKVRVTERLYEEHKDLLEAFWSRMIDLGRLPLEDEFEQYDALREKIGTLNRAKKIFIEKYGPDTLNEAFRLKREDLLIYLALSGFRKKVPFKFLPNWLQTDIKTFFGSYAKALEEGKRMLFAAGNPEIITEFCDNTAFGYLDQQALYIHKSLIDDLPTILRIYLGCAEVLYGDLHKADVIKIHKRSGKVSVLKYDDFENKPFPELFERVKINLRNQNFYIFDHQASSQKQLLYFKERYVSKDHLKRVKWEKYSEKLRTLGFSEQMGFGPSKREFLALLKEKNLTTNLNRKRIRSA